MATLSLLTCWALALVCIVRCVEGSNPGRQPPPETEECYHHKPNKCYKPHEIWSRCSAHCQDTCDNYDDPDRVCTSHCHSGCVCEEGFVRSCEGDCVTEDRCHQECGVNEKYNTCGSYCPRTCKNRYMPPQACIALCKEGCECDSGFLRHDNGTCVDPDDCSNPECPANSHYDTCGSACPTTCDNYGKPPAPCIDLCVEGCFCNKGFIKDGINCVKPKDCPKPICGKNEVFSKCAITCPQTCEILYTDYVCPATNCTPGCNCISEYLRDVNGTCIPSEKCPTKTCPINEMWVDCEQGYCVPKRCDELGYPVPCPDIDGPCDGDCVCIEGFARGADGTCIPKEQCNICGGDKYARSGCSNYCGKTCKDYNKPPKPCPYFCQYNGCDCLEGYLFDDTIEKCVLPKDCPGNTCKDPNAEQVSCASACPPTCAKPSPGICLAVCGKDGCQCKKGYILSKIGGKCIKISDCPTNLGCNGDKNSTIKEAPSPCPPTCDEPVPKACTDVFIPIGCECKPGYIKSSRSGPCIRPEDCEGGKPHTCPKGEQWVKCEANVCIPKRCSDLGYPLNCTKVDEKGCPGGCICASGSVRNDKGKCIKVKDCPSCGDDPHATQGCGVHCRNKCSDYQDKDKICGLGCIFNGCNCRENYVFNEDSGKCILPKDCPNTCKDPNAEQVSCASACPPTCAKPSPGPCAAVCVKNGCSCKRGSILSKVGGTCVKISECPTNLGCNGDKNSTIKEMPSPCPPTCDEPEPKVCPAIAILVGCQCNPGYIKSSSSGSCISPLDCGGDKPCGKNATYSYCNVDCRNDYCPVDDNRPFIACDPPYPCPPGCRCNINYRRKSAKDHKCILASECPPVNCTRPNEVFDPCPSACLAERCEDVNKQPVTCNTLLLNCQPQCVCKKGFYRNSDDICVPANKCPNTCKDPNAEQVSCASACPPTCAKPSPGACEACVKNGCSCKRGYILSKVGSTCVKISDCPTNLGCNGDKNSTIKELPSPCPPTCDEPQPKVCTAIAILVGCQCNPGYIKSSRSGSCISPLDCGGDKPCGKNASYSNCNVNCRNAYCPVDDSRVVIACDPPYPCPSGCHCRINYRRKSEKDHKCILAAECPPVNCTRPNEVWDPCPSACLAERCEDVDKQPVTCNTLLLNCQPQCVCKKGFYRDSDDICVPAKKCPRCGPNEHYLVNSNECRKTCYNIHPPAPPSLCKPTTGCFCDDGYVRANKDASGPCIKAERCSYHGYQPKNE